MHAVIAEQVGIRFDGAEIVDGNDFDIGPPALDDGAQHVATNTAETVDRDPSQSFLVILRALRN